MVESRWTSGYQIYHPMNTFTRPAYSYALPLSERVSCVTHHILVHLFLLLAVVPVLQAQVGFSIGSQIAQPGTTIEVPVQVAQFDNIGGFQFSLAWDPAVISFQEVTNYDLDKIELFDYHEDMPGSFRAVWQADNPDTGFSVEDGHTIFTLKFVVVGSVDDSTWISFSDVPLEPEVVNYNNDIMPVEFTFGLVRVDEGSAARALASGPIVVQIIPNPCREWCDVLLSVTQSMDVHIRVVDLSGNTVYQIDRHLEPGQQEVSLPAVQALASGGYFIMVETSGSRYIKRMLVQK